MIRIEEMRWHEFDGDHSTDICPQDLGQALKDCRGLESASLILRSGNRLYELKLTKDGFHGQEIRDN